MRLARLLLLAVVVLGASPARALAAPEARIVVTKRERRLSLYEGSRVVKTYRVSLGPQPAGPKRREGDGATPEGEYYITHANPRSRFHRSLGLSYPNAADARDGLARGLITRAERDAIATAIANRERPPQHTALGGDVFLHGGGTSTDWTLGCVALSDDDIDDLAARAPAGTRVTILP
jgi:murein L,D-transpeptidase YafK